jgi:NtrC-family two-component system response regulator AlgB
MNKALIIDDDAHIRRTLAYLLEARGLAALEASSGAGGLELFEREAPDVVLLDLKLPDRDGLEVLDRLHGRAPGACVVIITGHASVDTALAAVKKGAFDYLVKPFSAAQVEHVLNMAGRVRRLESEVQSLRSELSGVAGAGGLVTRDQAMRELLGLARQVADSSAGVLLTGETGTGKGLLAREIHAWSPRAERPFITVDCAALKDSLLESELFGHARGAFTGAVRDHPGKLESADGGTAFLDEIGELPPELQAKLLRFLQSQELERLGENRVRRVDVRIIAATNRDLPELVREGRFRQDLYFRLNVVELRLPPLRERLADIVPLAEHYLAAFAKRHGRPVRGIDQEAMAALGRYAWPGNVRELVNVVERAVVLARGETLTIRDLPPGLIQAGNPPAGELPTLEELERAHIQRVLAHAASLEQAARTLGIDPATLWRKRKRYGLG